MISSKGLARSSAMWFRSDSYGSLWVGPQAINVLCCVVYMCGILLLFSALPYLASPHLARQAEASNSPFADDEESNPFDDHDGAEPWALQGRVEELTTVFNSYAPENGKLSGTAAKKAMVDTGVDKKILRNLWPLADIDRDGKSYIEARQEY